MNKLVNASTIAFFMFGLSGCGNSSTANSVVHVFCKGEAQADIFYIDKIKDSDELDDYMYFNVSRVKFEAEIKFDPNNDKVLILRETPFNLEDLWAFRNSPNRHGLDIPAYAANDIALNGFGSCDGPEAQRKFQIVDADSVFLIQMVCNYDPMPWVHRYYLDRLSGNFNLQFGMATGGKDIEPVARVYYGQCISAADRRF